MNLSRFPENSRTFEYLISKKENLKDFHGFWGPMWTQITATSLKKKETKHSKQKNLENRILYLNQDNGVDQ